MNRGVRSPSGAGCGLAALLLLAPACAGTAPGDPIRVRVPPAPPAVVHARVVQRARAVGYTVEVADLARGPVRIEAMTDDAGLVGGRPLSRTHSAFLVQAHPDGSVWIHAVGDGVDLRGGRMSAALRRELEELAGWIGEPLRDADLSAGGAGAAEARPPGRGGP